MAQTQRPGWAVRKDFVLASYNDIRTEIRDRVGYRDAWVLKYIFGSIIFVGVALGLAVDSDTRILLCLIMPLSSLIVAMNVAAQTKSIEDAADFVREALDPFFVEMGVANWDSFTRIKRAKADANEIKRNRRRRITDTVSLHSPSLLSLATAMYLILETYVFDANGQIPLAIWAFLFTIVTFFFAAKITWTAFAKRTSQPDKPILPIA